MPLYEYECDACSHRFEIIQKIAAPPPAACPNCGAPTVRKRQSAPAFQFKGTGWYVTDYARKDQGSGETKEGAGKEGASKDSPSAKEGTTKDTKATTDSTAKETSKGGESGQGSKGSTGAKGSTGSTGSGGSSSST